MTLHRTLHCISLALLLSLASVAWAESPRVLVLGDSLSAAYGIDEEDGWVNLLNERLEREGYPHTVVNASVSGETTEGGLKRLPRLLSEHNPEWVILELGGNDGLRGYPISDLADNLAAMIQLSREQGAEVVLLGMQIPPNYGPRYTDQFTAVYPQLAQEEDVPLVAFMLEGIATKDELMQRDGIHPNAEAQPKILENVWPTLREVLQAH
ncbi:acyl-CoA thioesterase-1 [Marinimicrobium koreense]|uniref:Acyl-CoA thioesterase-1 n=1 Tax=Marinimicrobium koreense TaxID=306545 RepID=A0A3N1NVK9_9GAMM|nr:arylesterase [Marinimicrobium koreense]ROQ19899.1 acyl-CoA thioesterase-1 [Marinimicrobium koreense]